jgi:hypothetical protein
MVASLFRLLETGLQDERLQYDGAKCSWKQFTKVWRRAGRFTTRWHRIDFNSSPELGRGAVADIPLKGEFLTRMFLVCTLPDIGTIQAEAAAAAKAAGGTGEVAPKFGWANAVGHAIVQQAQMIIGGNIIDVLDRNLLELLDEFYTPLEKVPAVNKMIGRVDSGYSATTFAAPGNKTVYIPLPFWFSRGDAACALPVDAIRNASIRVSINFAPIGDLYYTKSKKLPPDVITANTCGTLEAISRQPVREFSNCGGSKLWQLEGSQFYYQCTNGKIVTGLELQGEVCPAGPVVPPVPLVDGHLLCEYIYVDKPEANRFRLADIQIPITTHTGLPIFDTQGLPSATIPIRVGNPVRNLYWMARRTDAAAVNDWFSCSRDLVGPDGAYWWPDARGLAADQPGQLLPAWATRDTEPLRAVQITYEGNLNRVGSSMTALFRSILPSYEAKKSPWIHRYYYMYPFGILNNQRGVSAPCGEANLDKIDRINLRLDFTPQRGYIAASTVPRYEILSWVEEYNILRIYGGRAGLLFAN